VSSPETASYPDGHISSASSPFERLSRSSFNGFEDFLIALDSIDFKQYNRCFFPPTFPMRLSCYVRSPHAFFAVGFFSIADDFPPFICVSRTSALTEARHFVISGFFYRPYLSLFVLSSSRMESHASPLPCGAAPSFRRRIPPSIPFPTEVQFSRTKPVSLRFLSKITQCTFDGLSGARSPRPFPLRISAHVSLCVLRQCKRVIFSPCTTANSSLSLFSLFFSSDGFYEIA